jgi:NADPH-dependent ferric siderophore reductase
MPTAERIRHQPRTRILEVRDVFALTPQLLRVVLHADDFGGFHSAGADDHVKLMFSPEPGQPPILPRPEQPRYDEGVKPPLMRDFTPRRFDPGKGELVIDFVVHGDGPASTWAAGASIGAVVGQGGPRGSLVVSDDFDWYLLAGDETALPSIARRLEELPRGARAVVIVEVADAAGEIDLDTRAAIDLRWLHRDGAQAGATDLLEQAIRGLDLPGGDGFAWVAAEADVVRPLRAHLREERGLPKPFTRVTGYWKRGEPDHHDPPDEA